MHVHCTQRNPSFPGEQRNMYTKHRSCNTVRDTVCEEHQFSWISYRWQVETFTGGSRVETFFKWVGQVRSLVSRILLEMATACLQDQCLPATKIQHQVAQEKTLFSGRTQWQLTEVSYCQGKSLCHVVMNRTGEVTVPCSHEHCRGSQLCQCSHEAWWASQSRTRTHCRSPMVVRIPDQFTKFMVVNTSP